MTFLIIGLGSMGKRRVRNLQVLGGYNIIGLDFREDRRQEAKVMYGIQTISSFEEVNAKLFDALIISTPPDKHNQCITFALEKKKPAFVEASVILEGLEKLNMIAKKEKVLVAPSCTLQFHPAIKDIKHIVESGMYGNVTNFSYHCGQYLPDWHPWENIKDYYAGRKETGGGRELVPFELTWLCDVVGFPKKVKTFYGKTMDMGANIDDTYAVVFDFGKSYGIMIVDVVARYATRALILNMEQGQIIWRWDEGVVKLYEAQNERWIEYRHIQRQAAQGYNKNISEDMYIEEMSHFINAVSKKAPFPNTLDKDIRILKLLNAIEAS